MVRRDGSPFERGSYTSETVVSLPPECPLATKSSHSASAHLQTFEWINTLSEPE